MSGEGTGTGEAVSGAGSGVGSGEGDGVTLDAVSEARVWVSDDKNNGAASHAVHNVITHAKRPAKKTIVL